MRFASLLLLLFSMSVAAQRVEFNDPDLTFSFVKPSDWKVKDDLVVKVVPNDQSFESASTFFTITYFEGPEQTEESDIAFEEPAEEPAIPANLKEFKAGEVGRIYIADEVALWASFYHTQKGIRIKGISYVFKKWNQRFELTISAPIKDFEKMDILFQQTLSSIIIKKK